MDSSLNLVKKISICADDFGMSAEIDWAIFDLIEANRIQAVTCLVKGEHWPYSSKKLLELLRNSKIDLGIHFDISPFLIFSKKKVKEELQRQWVTFCRTMGRAPDFLDGHLYNHQLPYVRDVVLEFADQVKYVRGTGNFWKSALNNNAKEFFIKLCGNGFYKLSRKKMIPINKNLLGIYNFNRPNLNYSKVFTNFLKRPFKDSILVCHPGVSNKKSELWRRREFQFFMGPKFKELIAEYNISLVPFTEIVNYQ